ncbi:hypothetical protein [Chryseobacterium sp. Leaf394]|uniref:hypothetical protein n=1 Tax=Chryseobacterium sp. Leaf394 TaxID=1736361 RepID=UPI0006F89891|nr:hypothetical protein [Chryseobacterium sp. Leaf394]KQS93644.1 hypothetical protein ASG21_01325 [Chryseobacterium sp. Leaf394]
MAYYVEDLAGNKTYTFKIERPSESNSLYLENLVLHDMGNSQYNAYISKYDQTSLQNPSSIPIAELKNHITIRPIGSKKHDEIFGLYNPNPCFATTITGIETSYVGGTTCSDPGMHHTNPADCDCGRVTLKNNNTQVNRTPCN